MAPEEPLVLTEHQDLQEWMAPLEVQDLLVVQASQEETVLQDLLVVQEFPEVLDLRAPVDLLVLMVFLELAEEMEILSSGKENGKLPLLTLFETW